MPPYAGASEPKICLPPGDTPNQVSDLCIGSKELAPAHFRPSIQKGVVRMRSSVVRWGSLAYLAFSLTAIIWLSISVTSARTFRETALSSQATLLGNTLLGAASNLGQVSAQGVSSDDTQRLLVSAEASLAQVEIVALGYEQISGNRLPLGPLTGVYTAQIRQLREELGQGRPFPVETLADLRSDLDLLRKTCQVDVLVRGNQEQITAIFAGAAADLRVPAAKSSLQESNSQ